VILYNLKAFVPLIVAAFGAVGAYDISGSAAFAVVTAGFGAVVVDLAVLRFMADKRESSPVWIRPDAGGHVWFIPVWILGAIAMVAGAGMWMFGT
jgi:hypothetical protein